MVIRAVKAKEVKVEVKKWILRRSTVSGALKGLGLKALKV